MTLMKLRDVKREFLKFGDMSIDQLTDELTKLKKEAFNLRFQKATGQLENTARVREVRRSVARVRTALSAKRAEKV